MVYIWGPFAACLMGIGRGAMNAFLESVAGSGTNTSTTLIRDRPTVHTAVGNAEAALSFARAYLYDAVTKAWMAACEGAADPGPLVRRSPKLDWPSRSLAWNPPEPSIYSMRRRALPLSINLIR